MYIVGAQLLSLSCLFVSMVGTFLLPYWWIGRKSDSFGGARYHTALSLANCVSGGVFLAAFFVGLMPEVRETFDRVFESYGIHSKFPITEVVIFFGFIFALGIEQWVLKNQEKNASRYTSIPSVVEEGNKTELLDSSSSSKAERTAAEESAIDYDSDASVKTPSSKDMACDSNQNMNHVKIDHHDHAGHSHSDISHYLKGEAGLRFGMLMVSLGVHSLFEGLALGLQTSVPVLVNLMIGVAVHELLVAFAMGVNVSRLKLPTSTIVKLALIFSASIPVGQIIGLLIGYYRSKPAVAISAILQGLAAGTFVHVTFLEVIPAEFQEPNHRILKVFFLGLGFMLLLGCSVIMDGVIK